MGLKRQVLALIICSMAAFLLFASCQPAATSPTAALESAPPAATDESIPPGDAYPYPDALSPVNVPTDSYPSPEQASEASLYPETVEVPQPQQDSGVVTGTLVTAQGREVYLAPTLILGSLLYANDPEAPPLVEYSIESDPIAAQDQTGKFVFQNVEPGEYAIVIWTPESQTLIRDSRDEFIKVTVEAGQTTDLGELLIP